MSDELEQKLDDFFQSPEGQKCLGATLLYNPEHGLPILRGRLKTAFNAGRESLTKEKRELEELVEELRGDTLTDLLQTFEDALDYRPFLQFEIGYTRITDWMVHVNDKAGGVNRKVFSTQDPEYETACLEALKLLRKHISDLANKPFPY